MDWKLTIWALVAALYAFRSSKGKEGFTEYWCPYITGVCGLIVGLSTLGKWIFN